jgi:hypothetical protein
MIMYVDPGVITCSRDSFGERMRLRLGSTARMELQILQVSGASHHPACTGRVHSHFDAIHDCCPLLRGRRSDG